MAALNQTQQLAGSNPSAGTGFALEPVTPDQNSLTQFMRSSENTLAQQGAGAFKQGTQAVAPALQYFTKLLGGGAALDEATMPEQDHITDAFNRVRQMISVMPRGGGKASSEVQAPFQEIKQRADVKAQARRGAAGELAGLATAEQGLGLEGEKTAAANALVTRAQDIQGGTSQTFSQIVSALGSLI